MKQFDLATGSSLPDLVDPGTKIRNFDLGPDGLLYVAMYTSGLPIHRFDPRDGSFVDVWRQKASASKTLSFGPDGNLYAANGLFFVCYDGRRATHRWSYVDYPAELWDADFDSDSAYVVDRNDKTITRIDLATQAETLLVDEGGNASLERFYAPAIGPDGNLYVSTQVGGDGALPAPICRYDAATGAYIDDFVPGGTAGMGKASDIAFGPDGYLYAADNSNDRILRFDGTTGAFVDVFADDMFADKDGPAFLNFMPSDAAPANDLFLNGNFETNDTRYWDVTTAGTGLLLMTPQDGAGSYYAVRASAVNPGAAVTLSQDLTVPDAGMTVYFDYRFELADGRIDVLIDGNPVATIDAPIDPMADFVTYSVLVTDPTVRGRIATVSFRVSDGALAQLDNVALVPVPEPGTIVLLGLGAAALIARRVR